MWSSLKNSAITDTLLLVCYKIIKCFSRNYENLIYKKSKKKDIQDKYGKTGDLRAVRRPETITLIMEGIRKTLPVAPVDPC